MTAEDIFRQPLDKPRTPRSKQYREGVLAASRFRFENVPIEYLYQPGTSQFDAFFSGLDEGHRLWRERAVT